MAERCGLRDNNYGAKGRLISSLMELEIVELGMMKLGMMKLGMMKLQKECDEVAERVCILRSNKAI